MFATKHVMTFLNNSRSRVREITRISKTISLVSICEPLTTVRFSSTEKDACTEVEDMFISDMKNPYEPKKKMCILCKYKIALDYKNPKLLSQFISPYTGFVYDKHITNLCEAQQRLLLHIINRSRRLGYMPYLFKAPQYIKDPKLFDPFSPSRPNPY